MPRRLSFRAYLRGALVALVAAAVSLAGCGSDEGGQAASTADSGDAALFAQPAAATVPLAMRDVRFDPERLEVQAGALTEITLENAGDLDHDFSIERVDAEQAARGAIDDHGHGGDYDVHAAVGRKQTAQVRLKVAKAGTYEYFCSVPGHKSAGMRGTLVVR